LADTPGGLPNPIDVLPVVPRAVVGEDLLDVKSCFVDEVGWRHGCDFKLTASPAKS
jgi:hypothetical protein